DLIHHPSLDLGGGPFSLAPRCSPVDLTDALLIRTQHGPPTGVEQESDGDRNVSGHEDRAPALSRCARGPDHDRERT
ncbi:MAG: hypothetical protein M3380_04315, partial [Chloroflexota bacterium]|nr:hypothetical protein [Chloroflexota bacterium]